MPRCAHHLEGRAEEPSRDLALVNVEGCPRRRGQHEQWMGADDHRHRKPPAGRCSILQEAPEIAPGVQAGTERGRRGHDRTVVAEVAAATFGILGHHDAAGYVGAAVGREMSQQRQPVQVDAVAHVDSIGDRSVVELSHLHRARGQMLVAVVELSRAGAQHPLDAHARGKEVGDDFAVSALHAPEAKQRMLTSLGQLPHDRGDVLVQRDRAIDGVDVGRMRGLVVAEEVFETLAGHSSRARA